jgi:hypothetical protein
MKEPSYPRRDPRRKERPSSIRAGFLSLCPCARRCYPGYVRVRHTLAVAPLLLACSIDESGISGLDGGIDASNLDADLDTLADSYVPDTATDGSQESVVPFSPLSIGGLAMWLRADRGITLDTSNNVEEWDDQSAFGAIATQPTASSRPRYSLHQINAQPTVSFVAAAASLLQISTWPPLSGAHAFVVQQRIASPPTTASETGFWYLTGDQTYVASVPFTDNHVYDNFGSTTRHLTPTVPSSMAQPNIYEVVSRAGIWSAAENGTVFFTSTGNSVSFASSPLLIGANTLGEYYDGDWAELIIYDHELSSQDRIDVLQYLAARYGITL